MVDVPGTSLMPAWIMGPSYLIFMGWLFMGIAISADIFMEAIEVITSQTTMVTVVDHDTQTIQQMEVVVWNPTLANLTLMAFGSSAPEIILSVLEAVKDLGNPAGDLGPSTIVGSAAFNLLVISAVSIIAIGDSVKKIDDMGVFITTAVFSVFAYVWMYYCLSINTPGEVDTTEAYLTFGYFFILLILAFAADKFNQKKKKKLE
jgi:solute carrier family 8 (sodium/calcium exchanger)